MAHSVMQIVRYQLHVSIAKNVFWLKSESLFTCYKIIAPKNNNNTGKNWLLNHLHFQICFLHEPIPVE